MVKCGNCKFGELESTDNKDYEMYHCLYMNEYLTVKDGDNDLLPCDFYVYDLDDDN